MADVKSFLDKIAQLESSSGKNIEHKEMSSGIHAGDSAIGKYGLMPNTIDEVVKRDKTASDAMKSLLKMSGQEKEQYLLDNPDIEYKLAEQLATHVLKKQGNDQEKAAYSWLYGHNLTPEKIKARDYENDPYVKKLKQLMESDMDKNKTLVEPGSPEESKLKNYIEGLGNPNDEASARKAALQQLVAKQNEQMRGTLNGVFRDTGRVADNPGEYLDAVLGVPARTAVSEMQKGNFNLDMLKKSLGSIGTDPRNAPTGAQIAEATGVENPYLGAALATAVDVGAQVPGVGALGKVGAVPGVVGKIAKVEGGLDDVAKAAPKFESLKKMFQVGDVSYPAASTAEALKIKEALEKTGKVGKSRALTEKK
jgi:hypothetical protein